MTSAAHIGPRKAGVLGTPIGHSKSPLLHRAAYRALGLDGWTYDAIECDAEALPELVDGLGPEWVGLSVTMPGKFAALEYASERTERAVLAGSANTLVRVPGGWRADCTDVDGVLGALAELGVTQVGPGGAVVIGAGGTSRPALVGLAQLGAPRVTVASRSRQRAAGALELAQRLGMAASWSDLGEGLGGPCAEADVVVSTVPAEAAAPAAAEIARARKVLDVIYDPWPTPLAAAVEAAGGTVVGGLSMLLNQAYSQVEQFAGQPAPRAAMAAAIA